jgi:hypothetical protein
MAGAQVNVETVLDQVRSGVKPEEAMAYMRQTYSTDRWFTFPKFQETAEHLKQAMTAAGLQNVEILSAPADGVTQVGYWTEPLAWDVKQARLELIGDVPAEFRVLADFEKVPTSLGMWSGSTRQAGAHEAESGEHQVAAGEEGRARRHQHVHRRSGAEGWTPVGQCLGR